MAKSTGILLDDTMDLIISPKRELGLITSGFVIGDVTRQNQKLIINSAKGEIKEDPLVGVGIGNFLETNDNGGLAREIRSQLWQDGQQVKEILVQIPYVRVEASYD